MVLLYFQQLYSYSFDEDLTIINKKQWFYFSLYPAGINIVSIPLTRLQSTRWAIRKTPVPIVTPGRQKQLFFLNFNIDGNTYIDYSFAVLYLKIIYFWFSSVIYNLRPFYNDVFNEKKRLASITASCWTVKIKEKSNFEKKISWKKFCFTNDKSKLNLISFCCYIFISVFIRFDKWNKKLYHISKFLKFLINWKS